MQANQDGDLYAKHSVLKSDPGPCPVDNWRYGSGFSLSGSHRAKPNQFSSSILFFLLPFRSSILLLALSAHKNKKPTNTRV